MRSNKFGGRRRLDKIDLIKSKTSQDSNESVLFRQVILDAVHQYLFFGLASKNGTSREEFFYATEYLFKINSVNKKTWPLARVIKIKDPEMKGRRKHRKVKLSDEDIKLMCFDMHYQMADFKTPIDVFKKNLLSTRRQILTENKPSVLSYLSSLMTKNNYNHGYSITDVIDILTLPNNPEELAKLVCYVQKKDGSNEENNCNNN